MADVKWIKIVTDIFDDEKILLIESMPDADSIIVIWFKLLTLAGKINNGGVLMLNDKLPYTDEMLSTIFRRPINTVRLAIRTFEQFCMIEVINNAITIPNWSKHQTLEQLKQKNEYMKNYMRDYRDKQKLLATGKVNGKTNSKANSKANVSEAEEDIDIDNNYMSEVSGETTDKQKKFEANSNPYKCAVYLARRIKERIPNKAITERQVQSWAYDFDKLNRLDNQKWETIAAVLDFSQTDSFWQSNILSASKFRKQFDQLYLKMQKEQP